MPKLLAALLLLSALSVLPAELVEAAEKSGDATDLTTGVTPGSAGTNSKLVLYNKLKKDLENKRTELVKVERDVELKRQQLILIKHEIDVAVEQMQEQRKDIESKCAAAILPLKERVEKLVSIYSSMPPEEAAERVARLDKKSLLMIFRNMNAKKVANILSFVEPEQAALISQDMLEPE